MASGHDAATATPDTGTERRNRAVVVAAFFAIAASPVALASFEYMVVAMQTEMGFSADKANSLTLLPAAASLLVVFVAGSLGDRLGYRKVMFTGAVLYCVGALMVVVAPSLAPVVAGRVLVGIGIAALKIIGIAALNQAYTEPVARAKVYGAFAALYPAVFIVMPPVSAWLVEAAGWRSVTGLWFLVGITAGVLCLRAIPGRSAGATGSERLLAPILAGMALMGMAMAATLSAGGAVLGAACLLFGLLALGGLVAVLRADKRAGRRPTLDLRVAKQPWAWLLLLVLLVASAPNLFFFTNLLLQYRYQQPLTTLAVVLIIPQVAAVAGGLLSGQISARIGPAATSLLALGLAAVTSLGTLFVTPAAPLWVPVAVLTLCAAPIAGAVGPVTETVMNLAPADGSGAASSLRDGFWTLGGAVGGSLLGLLGFTVFQSRLAGELNRAGLAGDQARAIAEEIRNGAVVEDLAASARVPDGAVQDQIVGNAYGLLDAQSYSYAVVGVASSVAYLVAGALMAWYIRRTRAAAAAPGSPAAR